MKNITQIITFLIFIFHNGFFFNITQEKINIEILINKQKLSLTEENIKKEIEKNLKNFDDQSIKKIKNNNLYQQQQLSSIFNKYEKQRNEFNNNALKYINEYFYFFLKTIKKDFFIFETILPIFNIHSNELQEKIKKLESIKDSIKDIDIKGDSLSINFVYNSKIETINESKIIDLINSITLEYNKLITYINNQLSSDDLNLSDDKIQLIIKYFNDNNIDSYIDKYFFNLLEVYNKIKNNKLDLHQLNSLSYFSDQDDYNNEILIKQLFTNIFISKINYQLYFLKEDLINTKKRTDYSYFENSFPDDSSLDLLDHDKDNQSEIGLSLDKINLEIQSQETYLYTINENISKLQDEILCFIDMFIKQKFLTLDNNQENINKIFVNIIEIINKDIDEDNIKNIVIYYNKLQNIFEKQLKLIEKNLDEINIDEFHEAFSENTEKQQLIDKKLEYTSLKDRLNKFEPLINIFNDVLSAKNIMLIDVYNEDEELSNLFSNFTIIIQNNINDKINEIIKEKESEKLDLENKIKNLKEQQNQLLEQFKKTDNSLYEIKKIDITSDESIINIEMIHSYNDILMIKIQSQFFIIHNNFSQQLKDLFAQLKTQYFNIEINSQQENNTQINNGQLQQQRLRTDFDLEKNKIINEVTTSFINKNIDKLCVINLENDKIKSNYKNEINLILQNYLVNTILNKKTMIENQSIASHQEILIEEKFSINIDVKKEDLIITPPKKIICDGFSESNSQSLQNNQPISSDVKNFFDNNKFDKSEESNQIKKKVNNPLAKEEIIHPNEDSYRDSRSGAQISYFSQQKKSESNYFNHKKLDYYITTQGKQDGQISETSDDYHSNGSQSQSNLSNNNSKEYEYNNYQYHGNDDNIDLRLIDQDKNNKDDSNNLCTNESLLQFIDGSDLNISDNPSNDESDNESKFYNYSYYKSQKSQKNIKSKSVAFVKNFKSYKDPSLTQHSNKLNKTINDNHTNSSDSKIISSNNNNPNKNNFKNLSHKISENSKKTPANPKTTPENKKDLWLLDILLFQKYSIQLLEKLYKSYKKIKKLLSVIIVLNNKFFIINIIKFYIVIYQKIYYKPINKNQIIINPTRKNI